MPRTTQVAPLSRSEQSALRLAIAQGTPIELGAPAAEPAPQSEDPCAEFASQLPADMVHGYVTVPEDYEAPEGRKIRVFYYARLAKDWEGNLAQPVVFFNGGPASDSHAIYPLLESSDIARALSMTYIDQRGTGCSDPFPASPINGENALRLSHYGTREIVRDAEAVRLRLFGADVKWHAFGQSYGGYIVHRYLETAPEGLSGGFAHGSSIMSDGVTWLSERIRSQKRVADDYFAEFPQDRERLARLRRLIPETRCFESAGSRICGPAVLDAGTALLGFRSSWGSLHYALQSLTDRHGRLSERALHQFVRQFVFGSFTANGFAAAVLGRLEVSPGLTEAQGCLKSIARLKAEGEAPETWAFNECRMLTALHNEWDSTVDAMHLNDLISVEEIARQLKRFPELPFYLYSGQKDVFVPVATFRDEVALLGPRVTYRDFAESGHEGFYSELQIWNDLNFKAIGLLKPLEEAAQAL